MSGAGYKPPNWGETWTAAPSYEDLFGVPDPVAAERAAFEAKEKEKLREEKLTQEEQKRIERLNELGFNKKPTSLKEAKAVADAEYVNYLKQSLNNKDLTNNEKNQIQALIRKGALDFNKKEDFETYHSVQEWRGGKNRFGWEQHKEELNTVEEIHSRAFDAQRLSMSGYLDRNNIDSYGKETYTTGANVFGDGSTMETRYVLNTGTALDAQSMNPNADNFTIGEVGTYGNIAYYDNVEPKKTGIFKGPLQDIFEVGMDILSIVYPPVAPVLQGVKTISTGGDFEDIIESVATTYVGKKFADIADSEIIKGFEKAGIDITALPTPAQNIILDTSKAVLEGDSGTDAFKKSATGELLDSIDINIDSPNIDFKTPQIVKDFGDAIVKGVETVGDVAEDILKPPLDFVADTFEPAVDFIDEKLDALGESYVDPALQTAKDVGQKTIDVIADLGEPVVDVIDEGLDILGEKVVDPALQAGKEFGQDVIDVGSDVLSEAEDIFIEPIKQGVEALSDVDLPDIDLPDFDLPDLDIDFSLPSLGLGGMLAGGSVGQQKTETEELFDKELFKFDTEIKSTQEMLSPIMNLRRYG
jgi:hypothetical protein